MRAWAYVWVRVGAVVLRKRVGARVVAWPGALRVQGYATGRVELAHTDADVEGVGGVGPVEHVSRCHLKRALLARQHQPLQHHVQAMRRPRAHGDRAGHRACMRPSRAGRDDRVNGAARC